MCCKYKAFANLFNILECIEQMKGQWQSVSFVEVVNVTAQCFCDLCPANNAE